MLFNTTTFFIFLAITFLVYWKTAGKSNRNGNLVLLCASYIFYGWWDWRFLILIVISSATDFFIGSKIFKTSNFRQRKLYLACSILVNTGFLFVFKYFNFFIESFAEIFGNQNAGNGFNTLYIILPVGISFYTFQTLSYTLDIYRGKGVPTRSASVFFTFVAFFPQLVAGPIERANRLIPQFEKKATFNYNKAVSGVKIMIWGFFKKMVIADQLGKLVDAIYAAPEQFNGFALLAATFLFGFQIYCDFSGYSDIAIGVARLFGKDLMINFKTPYFSSSLREFWHRWHISLSTWFRDYIYFSMGGSRTSTAGWVRNILVTFAISGLWHGANTTFILWGTLHGVLLVAERFIQKLFCIGNEYRKIAGVLLTFTLTNFCWILFRSADLAKASFIFNRIFSASNKNFRTIWDLLFVDNSLTDAGRMLVFVFPFFIVIEYFLKGNSFDEFLSKKRKAVQVIFLYMIVVVILFFGVLNAAPQFIYFQF